MSGIYFGKHSYFQVKNDNQGWNSLIIWKSGTSVAIHISGTLLDKK